MKSWKYSVLLLCCPLFAQPDLLHFVRSAPSVNPVALTAAFEARDRAKQSGVTMRDDMMVLIDYSKPSTQPRMWVFDLNTGKAVYEELVAHGQGSGENMAVRFSNRPNSHMTSLGLFVTTETYVGRNGYSLRLKGLDPGVNDRSLDRAIVIHGTDYVSESSIRRLGRLGRSHGCPAVRRDIAHALIDLIRDGTPVYAWYPQQQT